MLNYVFRGIDFTRSTSSAAFVLVSRQARRGRRVFQRARELDQSEISTPRLFSFLNSFQLPSKSPALKLLARPWHEVSRRSSSFWLQSTNTFPLRTALDMLDVMRSACSRSRYWARDRDQSLV